MRSVDAEPRGLDRLLPPLVWGSPELRPRGRALVRVALWLAAWAAVVAACLHRGGRAEWAVLVVLFALASTAALPRLRRTADPPSSARWLGWSALCSAFFGALASGGASSPVLFGAGVGAATSAAFGSAHGVAMALLVPVGLFVAEHQGVVEPALEGLLGSGLALATLALVAGATAELVVAERAARAEVKGRALRQGMLSRESAKRELDELRMLLDGAPWGLFSVDADGRVGAAQSPALEGLLGSVPPGTELLALLARAGDPAMLREVRAGLAAWARGDGPERVVAALPTRMRWGRDELELRFTPVPRPDGRLERVVVAVRGEPAQVGLPAGSSALAELLGRSAERGEARGATVVVEGDVIAVPVEVEAALESAIDALVENAVIHGFGPERRRRARGKPGGGRIELRAERRGRGIAVSVTDDGAGFDWARVTELAHQRGWAAESHRELEEAVTSLGFSTAGRSGQGLARVRTTAESLGGNLTFGPSIPGEGTVVELLLPAPIPKRLRVSSAPTSSPSRLET